MTSTNLSHPKSLGRTLQLAGLVLGMTVAVSACGAGPSDAGPSSAPGGTASATADIAPSTENADHPDVLAAVLTSEGDGLWALDVTLSSQYDSPERYADGWRVLDEGGTVLGEHTLTHDHANEQPVTRTQTGLEIPEGVDEVTVEGKDTANGYGGATLTVQVPR